MAETSFIHLRLQLGIRTRSDHIFIMLARSLASMEPWEYPVLALTH
jgi:hypothetical protein